MGARHSGLTPNVIHLSKTKTYSDDHCRKLCPVSYTKRKAARETLHAKYTDQSTTGYNPKNEPYEMQLKFTQNKKKEKHTKITTLERSVLKIVVKLQTMQLCVQIAIKDDVEVMLSNFYMEGPGSK